MDEKTEGLVGGMDSQGHGRMQLKTKAGQWLVTAGQGWR